MSRQISVGSAKGNDVVVISDYVSRKHLTLQVHDPNHIVLTDLNSSNGTFVWQNDAWLRISKPEQVTVQSFVMLADTKLRVMEIIICEQVKHRSSTQ